MILSESRSFRFCNTNGTRRQTCSNSSPEVIAVGTGVSGGMIPDKNLKADLAKLTIEFIAVPNEEAIKIFNKLAPEKRIGGGFHLTC